MKHYEEYKHLIFSKIQEYHGELAALNDYLADHPEIERVRMVCFDAGTKAYYDKVLSDLG